MITSFRDRIWTRREEHVLFSQPKLLSTATPGRWTRTRCLKRMKSATCVQPRASFLFRSPFFPAYPHPSHLGRQTIRRESIAHRAAQVVQTLAAVFYYDVPQ